MNEFFGAAASGDIEAVKVLVGGNADLINATDENGKTALFYAAHNAETNTAHPAVVDFLINAGADVNHKMVFGITPLMMASGGGEGKICEMLLEAGADPLITNESGRMALDMAKERFFIDVINILHEATGSDGLGNGIDDPNSCSSKPWTAKVHHLKGVPVVSL